MRVLMINQVFYPDVAATAQHAHDLARHLVEHGHEVHAIASRSIYGEKGAVLPRYEVIDGIHIHRVGRSLFGKSSIVARAMDFCLFYLVATIKALTITRPDVSICFTTPPFIALLGWLLRVTKHTKFVYWVMDLYPDLPVACDVMKPRALTTRFFEAVNRFCLRNADRTVVLGRCMLERVRDKGVLGDHVVRISVWSDQSEVKPIEREGNPYRSEWNLGDRFVVMYSGNFGLGHDVDTMCQAALQLRDDDHIHFLFVGGGKKKTVVDDFVRTHELTNCTLAPYQPRERLDQSLSCADVHLASLAEGIEGIMVPCKLFGIMAAGRPTIFIGNPTSELARVLTEYKCGIVVQQNDVDGLINAIQKLANNEDEVRAMGERALHALGEVYSRAEACNKWQTLLEEVVSESPYSHASSHARRPSVRERDAAAPHC